MICKLTQAQKDKVQLIQERSFKNYCAFCGYDEHEHAALLFDLLRKKWESITSGVDLEAIPDEEQKARFHAILKADNFLDLRGAENEDRRLGYAKTVGSLADRLPINVEYVSRLCGQLGLSKPQPNNPGAISALLEAVPLLSNWELEFNAFIEGASLIDGLPCICIYEVLLSACEAFLDCVAPAAIEFGAKSRARALSDCRTLGSKEEFMETLESCLRLSSRRK